MRLSGRITQDGKPVALQVVLVGDRGGRGTVTADGTTFQVIRIGELLWFNAPRSFYARQPSLPVDLLAGRWLEASAASGQFAEFASFTRSRDVAEQLLTTEGELDATPTTVGGVAATALSTTSGRVVVADAAPGLPLLANGAAGTGDTLSFNDYGAPVQLEKPAQVVTAAQVASALAGQGR